MFHYDMGWEPDFSKWVLSFVSEDKKYGDHVILFDLDDGSKY